MADDSLGHACAQREPFPHVGMGRILLTPHLEPPHMPWRARQRSWPLRQADFQWCVVDTHIATSRVFMGTHVPQDLASTGLCSTRSQALPPPSCCVPVTRAHRGHAGNTGSRSKRDLRAVSSSSPPQDSRVKTCPQSRIQKGGRRRDSWLSYALW